MKKLFEKFGKKEAADVGLVGKTVLVGSFSARVEALIGEGGLATVYRVVDVNTSQQYALKHMRLHADSDAIKDVQHEAKVMTKLKGHPNVLQLRAVAFAGPAGAETDGFMLLDYCPITLLDTMQQANFNLDNFLVFEVFSEVCAAVAHMHRQSPPLAHRDLKAENILKNTEGRWVLSDFGSSTTRAQVYETPAEIAAEEENIRRNTTPAYRAPEMWDLYNRQRIDEKADIWALGVLLYVLAFGKLPFPGESKLAILYGKYEIPPGRPQPLCALIRDLLTVDPAARPDIFTVISRLDELKLALSSSLGGVAPNGMHQHPAVAPPPAMAPMPVAHAPVPAMLMPQVNPGVQHAPRPPMVGLPVAPSPLHVLSGPPTLGTLSQQSRPPVDSSPLESPAAAVHSMPRVLGGATSNVLMPSAQPQRPAAPATGQLIDVTPDPFAAQSSTLVNSVMPPPAYQPGVPQAQQFVPPVAGIMASANNSRPKSGAGASAGLQPQPNAQQPQLHAAHQHAPQHAQPLAAGFPVSFEPDWGGDQPDWNSVKAASTPAPAPTSAVSAANPAGPTSVNFPMSFDGPGSPTAVPALQPPSAEVVLPQAQVGAAASAPTPMAPSAASAHAAPTAASKAADTSSATSCAADSVHSPAGAAAAALAPGPVSSAVPSVPQSAVATARASPKVAAAPVIAPPVSALPAAAAAAAAAAGPLSHPVATAPVPAQVPPAQTQGRSVRPAQAQGASVPSAQTQGPAVPESAAAVAASTVPGALPPAPAAPAHPPAPASVGSVAVAPALAASVPVSPSSPPAVAQVPASAPTAATLPAGPTPTPLAVPAAAVQAPAPAAQAVPAPTATAEGVASSAAHGAHVHHGVVLPVASGSWEASVQQAALSGDVLAIELSTIRSQLAALVHNERLLTQRVHSLEDTVGAQGAVIKGLQAELAAARGAQRASLESNSSSKSSDQESDAAATGQQPQGMSPTALTAAVGERSDGGPLEHGSRGGSISAGGSFWKHAVHDD